MSSVVACDAGLQVPSGAAQAQFLGRSRFIGLETFDPGREHLEQKARTLRAKNLEPHLAN
jgi:hypothetical protein